MSQTTNEKPLQKNLPVLQPTEEVQTWGDRLLESIRPHLSLIALGAIAILLLVLAIAWTIKSRTDLAESQWILLNQQMGVMNVTGSTSDMKSIASDYPDGSAGLWGLQMAGDFELQKGLQQLITDRTEGFKSIGKARDTLKKLVELPDNQKSSLLQTRSVFALAYAYESLGEFDKAKEFYGKLVKAAPETAFGKKAQRGLDRCNDPGFAVVFQKFKDWEEPVAPGAPGTQKPDISFPDVPEGEGAATTEKKDEPATTEKPAAEVKPADEKPAAEVKPSDEKPADAKPADEKPADVKPADEKPDGGGEAPKG